MKKILFATTALVATAGVAAADVKIGGWAEVGIVGGSRYGDVTQFHTDVDVDFDMSGEADNGLTFGASVDLDESASGLPASNDNGVSYFVAFGNARMDAGDTDGAFDWALSEVALAGGSIDDSETEHPGYNGNSGFDGTHDGQIMRFTYSFGDFAAALSAEVDDAKTAGKLDDPVWGLGFKYSGDLGGTTLGVGLGYQTRDASANGTDELIGLSVSASMPSGFSVAVNYSQQSDTNGTVDDVTHTGIGFGYTMNALAIGLNYGEYENYAKIAGVYSPNASSNGFGLAATYDLGGGLAVKAGFGSGEYTNATSVTTDWDSFSIGLAMSF